jgi:peptide/nickel transport system substrate-binding protein
MKRNLVWNNILAIVACVLTVVIALTACAQPAKQAATPASIGPKMGGTIRIGIPTGPISLDSFIAGTGGIVKIFGEPVIQWTGKNDIEAVVAPLIAKSWEISPDGLTYTFHLQEGVKWQNIPPVNGRELTADDFTYHLNRIIDPANRFNGRLTMDMKSAVAVDKYTFKVTTNKPSPGFLAYCAGGTLVPYAKEVVGAPGGADKNWVGTGPFILTDYVKDSKAILKKNPDYWQKGKPYLDTVELYFIPDESAQLAAFRSGQIDVLPSQSKNNVDAIVKSIPGAQIQAGVNTNECGLNLNLTKAPFNNKLVRQAIQYAIDYDGLITSALDGSGVRTGFLATQFADYGAKQVADLPKRDIAKAKALMVQAGYPNGFKASIMQNTSAMSFAGNAVEPLVAMLKDIGIESTIVPADQATFISKWRALDYDMAVYLLLTGRPFDPDNSLRQAWQTGGGANFIGYSNPKMDELIKAEEDVFPDKAKRVQIIKQILGILEDEVPSVPLYIRSNYFVKQPYVKGWDNMADPQSASALHSLPGVWIDK